MCGVVAAVSLDGASRPVDLQPALAALQHRGPDGRGVWTDPTGAAALGHVRLAIVDLARGAQPLASEDGAVVATVNGEFYGFEAQRAELQSRGHAFATGSDSEVLVHLYEERGDARATVDELRGEFAFALWDRRRRRLVAARDRFGIKPLVWTVRDGQLLVASEAKALFALGVTARWDRRSFAHVATHQYLPPDRTLFDGVHAVAPGHMLVAEEGDVRVVRYWDLDYPLEGSADPTDAEERRDALLAALDDAVDVRLRADVPIGFYLSGGLDSAAIAALAARRSATRPRCFAVSFGHAPYDELDHARCVADHIGATLEPVPVDQDALVESLPEAVRCAEGVGINGQFAAKFLLARAVARAGIKVVLTGEGADEALLGYPHLVEDVLRDSPAAQASVWRAALHRDTGACRGVMMPDGQIELPGVRRTLGAVPTWFEAKALLGRRVGALLSDDARAHVERRDVWGDLLAGIDVSGQLAGRPPVIRSAYLWSRLAMTGYIVRTLGDGTEMASSIEGRPAFLDHRLFEQTRRLPVDLLVRAGVEKWLLREAVTPLLPDAIARRRKHPFLAPPITAFSTGRVEAFVRDTLAADLPFFDRRRVNDLLDGLPSLERSQQAAAEPAVMIALCTAVLHRQFRMEVGT